MTPVRGIILLLIAVLLSSCSRPYAPVIDRSGTKPAYHRVSRGETVYSIAWMYGVDYRALARWNGIPRSYAIYPGQVLRLKAPQRKASARKQTHSTGTSTAAVPSAKGKTASSRPSQTTHTSRHLKKKPAVTSTRIQHWLWPVRGTLIRGFSSTDSGKKGIDIAGRYGQPVIASAAGKVVYSGDGLLRYGKLIIIKHNNTYLSAYAHNRRLLVNEGVQVKQGQKIAEMGRTGTDRTMLHFEIRKDGKPVNPLYYLPKK